MTKRLAWLIASLSTGGLLLALGLTQPQPVKAQTKDSVVYLDQGWSKADRETWYQVSQGSVVLDYDIFLNLEKAGGQELFRSETVSNLYGLTPQAPNSTTNPDGLPIGLSKTIVPTGRWKGEYVGLTCAACHNAELTYKDKKIRIDGGVGNVFDMMAYVGALDDALQGTLTDPAKFDRLAAKLHVSAAAAKSDLRKRFAVGADRVHVYNTRILVAPDPWGPARMDAIGLIVNRLTATEPGIPENWSTPLAPTKPPFLWNAPQGSWTQWRGVMQDPIQRNLTETLGVFLPMDLHSKSPEQGLFESNAALASLTKIENSLARLAPPKWPEEVFGKIDHAKADAGKALFGQHCAPCHNSYPYTWTAPNKYGKRFVEVGLVPQKYVGTDPGQFDDLRPYAITGQLAPYLPGAAKGKTLLPTGELYAILQKVMLARALGSIKQTDAEAAEMHGYREMPLPETSRVPRYKAAPRDGVWATPPFLHNGAVPNLYEMLVPAKDRTKKFYLGREFDPIKVGLDTSGKSGKFLLDTSVRGNSNAGHSFENGPRGNGVIGPLLTDTQRWALVEYLKSIPDTAARITPYGGPPNAQSGNSPWTKQP